MRNKNGIKRVKSQKRYPVDLKRKIGKPYLSGEASYAVLAEENDLKSKDVAKPCRKIEFQSERSFSTPTLSTEKAVPKLPTEFSKNAKTIEKGNTKKFNPTERFPDYRENRPTKNRYDRKLGHQVILKYSNNKQKLLLMFV